MGGIVNLLDAETGKPVRLSSSSDADGAVVLNVAIEGGSGGGSGTVAVSNFPVTQPVSGTVTADQGGAPWSVTLPAGTQVTLTGSNSVAVSNFPATQAVSGTVNISNLPATQAVSGTVSVSNLPATQPVSGTVSVGNFPATQAVSGTVGVSGTVAVQDSAAEGSLATIATQTSGLATASGQSSALTQATAASGALGTTADTAYAGSGTASIVAALKGLYAKLAGTVAVSLASLPALATGSNTIGAINLNTGTNSIGRVRPASSAGVAGSSTTIAAASTYQTLFTAGAVGNGFYVQNPSTNSVPLYVDPTGQTGTTLKTTSIQLAPGQIWVCPFAPTAAVTVFATSAISFIAGGF